MYEGKTQSSHWSNSDQLLSENHGTSQTNDSKRFRCNVPTRRAQEHAKSHHHFTIKSVAKLPKNPRVWKTVLKAHFQQIMTVFDDCLIFKTMLIDKNLGKPL